MIYIVSVNASNWFKTRSNSADIPVSAPAATVKPKSSNGADSDTKSSGDKSSAGNDKENTDKKHTIRFRIKTERYYSGKKSTQRTDTEKKTDSGGRRKLNLQTAEKKTRKKAEEPVEDNIDDAKTGDNTKSDTGNEESAENAESGLED